MSEPQPTITAQSAAARGSAMQVTGSGFGFVIGTFLVDSVTQNEYPVDHFITNGSVLQITVPRTFPDGTYYVRAVTLDGTRSTNTAGTFILPTSTPIPPLPPAPPNPIPDYATSAMATIRSRARLEYGDYEESFSATAVSDGCSARFDLPVEVIETDNLGVLIRHVNGTSTMLTISDYVLEAEQGVITLGVAPLVDEKVGVVGKHFQFFTDAQLDQFILSAALKHTHGVQTVVPYRDVNGFKQYPYTEQTVDSLNPVEYHPLAILVAAEALEILRSDASYDIDVTTAEGTSLPRSERFKNLSELITMKLARYDEICLQLGIGLKRVETYTLRRVSRTTGRLVPVYVPREFDETRTPPTRVYTERQLDSTGSTTTQEDPFSQGVAYP